MVARFARRADLRRTKPRSLHDNTFDMLRWSEVRAQEWVCWSDGACKKERVKWGAGQRPILDELLLLYVDTRITICYYGRTDYSCPTPEHNRQQEQGIGVDVLRTRWHTLAHATARTCPQPIVIKWQSSPSNLGRRLRVSIRHGCLLGGREEPLLSDWVGLNNKGLIPERV